MADPLPYYRVLRDEHPVYYLPQWDTFALSRFDDIWNVLEVNDGTFVASEGTLPAATVLANHNDGPVADPAVAPDAVSRELRRADLRGCAQVHSRQFRPKSVQPAGRPDPRAGQRTARRAAAARARSTSPRTTAASSPPRWSANYSACQSNSRPMCWPPSTPAAWPNRAAASKSRNARPGYLEYLIPAVRRRRAEAADGNIADRRRTARLPTARRIRALDDSRSPPRCSACSSAEPRPCRRSSRTGCGNCCSHPDQLAAVRADLAANVPVAREEMIRYCAPAQWFARTARKPVHHSRHHHQAGAADHHAARFGQPRRARIRRPRRVHLEPADPALAGLRPRTALLPRRITWPVWRSPSW